MISPAVSAKIFSQLGNSASLLPIGVKDFSHSVGLTTASYITGDKTEGKDRLIDEFGTQLIWIGGLPAYKWIIDKTLYKIAKYNPKIDVRILKDVKNGDIKNTIMQKAIEKAPTQEIKNNLQKIVKNKNTIKTFKGLFLAKFVAATLLTLGSYAALTTFRHKHTEKTIIKELIKENETKKANIEFSKKKTPLAFKAIEENKKNEENLNKKPSFGMNLKMVKDIMFNPVKNMMVVDGGITAERLAESRNPQDFVGYVIKEGSFWAFMYFVGPQIQKLLESKAEKKNKSIGLDIKVLQCEDFKKAIKNKTETEKMLKQFSENKTDLEIYDYICKNKNNLVVKMSKKSGIIKTIKNSEAVDTQHYIDLEKVKGVSEKIKTLLNQVEKAELEGETLEQFMKKLEKLKKASIAKNILSCVGVLGLVVPGIMLAMRFAHKDNKEFKVKKEIQEKFHQGLLG